MVVAGLVLAAAGCGRRIRLLFRGCVSPYFHLFFVARSLSLNRSCSLFFLAAVRLIVPGVLLFRLLLFRRWILSLCLIA
jgi:predicted acetyltransferase